jgi:hypothetical protein
MAAGAVVGRLAYAAAAMALVARAAGVAPARTALSTLWPVAWCALVTALIKLWLAPADLAALASALGLYAVGVAPALLALARSLTGMRGGPPALPPPAGPRTPPRWPAS